MHEISAILGTFHLPNIVFMTTKNAKDGLRQKMKIKRGKKGKRENENLLSHHDMISSSFGDPL
jgi:hypothetical protein